MSISSLTNAAIGRRPDFQPIKDVPKGLKGIAQAAGFAPPLPAEGQPSPGNDITNAIHVIAAYIPTEIITVYVAVLGSITHSGDMTSSSECLAFYSFLFATPLVAWVVFAAKVKTSGKTLPWRYSQLPVWEMSAATIAYFAWALALPTNPFVHSNWYSSSLAGIIVLITSTVLGLLSPIFQRPLRT